MSFLFVCRGVTCSDDGGDEKCSYDGDTLQTVFSSSKSLSAIVFATLVDRGLLDYSDKARSKYLLSPFPPFPAAVSVFLHSYPAIIEFQVSKHWPEFSAHGKDEIRVCDVLRHEAGLVYLDKTVMLKDMLPER